MKKIICDCFALIGLIAIFATMCFAILATY